MGWYMRDGYAYQKEEIEFLGHTLESALDRLVEMGFDAEEIDEYQTDGVIFESDGDPEYTIEEIDQAVTVHCSEGVSENGQWTKFPSQMAAFFRQCVIDNMAEEVRG